MCWIPSAIPLDVFGFRRYPRAQGERRLTIGFPAPLEGTETSKGDLRHETSSDLPLGAAYTM